jgi:cytoskeletal protein RodZ
VWTPPPVYTGYDQLQPQKGTGGRTGLIIGIALAIVIVLAGAAVALFLVLDNRGTSASATTVHQASSSTSGAQTTSTGVAASSTTATTTAVTTATTATPSTSAPSSTTVNAQVYLTATDALVKLLMGDDARIPVLADTINATAPNVPQNVSTELAAMSGKLDQALVQLGGLTAPSGFEQSNAFLVEAAGYMRQRIQHTHAGIETMRADGSVSSAATAYFEQGRTARDSFRAAFAKFQEAVPID